MYMGAYIVKSCACYSMCNLMLIHMYRCVYVYTYIYACVYACLDVYIFSCE